MIAVVPATANAIAIQNGAATTAAWLADSSSAVEGPHVLLVTGANLSEAVLQQALKID